LLIGYVLDVLDPLQMLRDRLKSQSLRSVARELDCSAAYLSDVMNGKRPVGPSIVEALGLEKIVSYRRKVAPQSARDR
jgi:hypothetical protein